MKKTESVWSREIPLPSLRIPSRVLGGVRRWGALVCVGAFLLSPLPVGVLCLIRRSIDYTVFAHPRVILSVIWPLSALAAFLALAAAALLARREGKGLRPLVRENPALLCFFLLVVWMLIATTVNGWSDDVLSGETNGLRFESVLMQLGYFLLLFPAASLLRAEGDRLRLARLQELVSLLMVPVSFILWKTQLTSVFIIDWSPAMTGIYSNVNYYGYYLSVSVPLAAAMFAAEQRAGWKLLSAVTVAANTVALSYNSTMGAWVACAAALIFLLIAHGVLERRLNLSVLAMAALFALCLWLPGHLRGNFETNLSQLGRDVVRIATNAEDIARAGSNRWIIWQRGLALIRDNPVFGIGFEGVYLRDLIDYARNYRVHNEYLQYALFYGIPAGIAYFAGCLGVFLRALRRRAALRPYCLACLTAAFGYLCSAFFGLTLYCTAPFLFLFLGLGYVPAAEAEVSQ